MPVADNIARGDVAGIIPEVYSNQFLDVIVENSAALRAFPTIRIGTKVNRFPVLSALPVAGFVGEGASGAGNVKPKSKVGWTNKVITAEEIAVIIPIHENVIEDATIDLWGQVRPLVGQAFGQVIDDAVFFGDGKPASWRAGLIPAAVTAGHVADATGTGNSLVSAFNKSFEYLEVKGHDPSVVFAGPSLRAKLRGLKDDNGNLIYADIKTGNGREAIYGADVEFVRNGVWADATAWALTVDRSKVIMALRTDMSYKLLDQATLGTGDDAINLAERDMVALRVKMRLGWEVATNATALDASPAPFSIVADVA